MKIKNLSIVAIILAGGFGSRMGNLTKNKHKTMLKIGNYPILAHLYTQLRINFIKKIIICAGYKGDGIKRYSNKLIKTDSDKILRLIKNYKTYDYPKIIISKLPPTHSTSQRIFKIKDKIKNDNFLLIYGDTLLKPRLFELKKYLINKKNSVTFTLSKPEPKFGKVKLKDNKITEYYEKSLKNESWVNSGWCLISSKLNNLFVDSKENFEKYFFNRIIKKNSLFAVKNKNFYLPIDTDIELNLANKLWKKNKKLWF